MPVDNVNTDPRRRLGMPDIADDEEGERFRNSLVKALLLGPGANHDMFTGIGGAYRGGSSYLKPPALAGMMFDGSLQKSGDLDMSLDFTPQFGSPTWKPKTARYPAAEEFY